jgi:hypothetical protein
MACTECSSVDFKDFNCYDSCDELFIDTVSVDSIQQSEDWKESVTINQKSVMLKLDTVVKQTLSQINCSVVCRCRIQL